MKYPTSTRQIEKRGGVILPTVDLGYFFFDQKDYPCRCFSKQTKTLLCVEEVSPFEFSKAVLYWIMTISN